MWTKIWDVKEKCESLKTSNLIFPVAHIIDVLSNVLKIKDTRLIQVNPSSVSNNKKIHLQMSFKEFLQESAHDSTIVRCDLRRRSNVAGRPDHEDHGDGADIKLNPPKDAAQDVAKTSNTTIKPNLI